MSSFCNDGNEPIFGKFKNPKFLRQWTASSIRNNGRTRTQQS